MFANEDISGKCVRLVCAATYAEHFGEKSFAIGSKSVK